MSERRMSSYDSGKDGYALLTPERYRELKKRHPHGPAGFIFFGCAMILIL